MVIMSLSNLRTIDRIFLYLDVLWKLGVMAGNSNISKVAALAGKIGASASVREVAQKEEQRPRYVQTYKKLWNGCIIQQVEMRMGNLKTVSVSRWTTGSQVICWAISQVFYSWKSINVIITVKMTTDTDQVVSELNAPNSPATSSPLSPGSSAFKAVTPRKSGKIFSFRVWWTFWKWNNLIWNPSILCTCQNWKEQFSTFLFLEPGCDAQFEQSGL